MDSLAEYDSEDSAGGELQQCLPQGHGNSGLLGPAGDSSRSQDFEEHLSDGGSPGEASKVSGKRERAQSQLQQERRGRAPEEQVQGVLKSDSGLRERSLGDKVIPAKRRRVPPSNDALAAAEPVSKALLDGIKPGPEAVALANQQARDEEVQIFPLTLPMPDTPYCVP
jgi:hypothetical protein